jgi:hypothetical protein
VSEPKKHHYLPEFYLKRFSRDGKIWVYDRERDDLSERRPQTVGIRKHFYRPEHLELEQEHQPETLLSKLESRAAPLIDKVDRGGRITMKDRYDVVNFAALLKSRVPSFERWLSDFHDDLWVHHLKDRFSTKKALREWLRQQGDEAAEDPAKVQEFFEEIQNGDFMLKTPKDVRIGRIFHLALVVMAEPLFAMRWEVMRAPQEAAFVTTDDPFVVVPPKGVQPEYPYVVGISVEGTKKIVPLTQRVCLQIGDAGMGTTYVGCSQREVMKVNEILATNHDRFLFGPDEALLTELTKAEVARQGGLAA